MSVIVELTLPPEDFELGRILPVEGRSHITLETLVPLGERPVPLFSITSDGCEAFEQHVNGQDAVEDLILVDRYDHQVLYALDWNASSDPFFDSVIQTNGHIVSGEGVGESWRFQLRFLEYDAFASFENRCQNESLAIQIERLYNPTRPDAGPWYGLTPRQRETLVRAVQGGYYSIPRGISTEELANEFDISDQAVTERLRRAIHTLTMNTLLVNEPSE